VPSVAHVLRKRGVLRSGTMPGLRWSLFCGETLPKATAQQWQAAAPNSVVENLYGPTELTIACTVHRWDPATSPDHCVYDSVPIGQPYPAMQTLVVDGRLQPLRDGEIGELCMAGPQSSPGYWRAPELTAERFFDHGGRRYYRTGDLVRQIDDELVHLGRVDQQVKIGGYRIELGEIEAVLRREGCVEAICLQWPDANTITAVVTGEVDADEMRDRLAETLPSYMLPQTVRVLPTLPLNANGKVDRFALSRWLTEDAARITVDVEESELGA
jgi:acyl-CoA synthetase (AMP-forming)/AMP-acid ligase II